MKHFLTELLMGIVLIAVWLSLLIPCYHICRYLATEHYQHQTNANVHEWFLVIVADEQGKSIGKHPNTLSSTYQTVIQPFDTGMGFYLQQQDNGIYEAGAEIGFGMARSFYRIENNTVQPVSFRYEGMHNVILPCMMMAGIFTLLLRKWAERWWKQKRFTHLA